MLLGKTGLISTILNWSLKRNYEKKRRFPLSSIGFCNEFLICTKYDGVKSSHIVAEIFGNVSVVMEWLAKYVGGPLAIRRSRRKEKASKTEKIVLAHGLSLQP